MTNSLLNFIAIVGTIETIALIIVSIRAIALWVSGILPALLRLGNGLAKRKVVIFAKSDNLTSLKGLLLDSKLFKAKNICEVTNIRDLGRAEGASVYLIFWHDWENEIDSILNVKPDNCALVVYAPRNMGSISNEQMQNLDDKRHTAVTNFRGRLLNDIVTSMITTSYE